MKKLLGYLSYYKKESVLGPLFKLLEASFELIVPLVIASMIDRGIKTGNNGYIAAMCSVLIGLGLIGLASSVTAQYYAAKASAGFAKRIKHALFVHMQSLSYSGLDQLGGSALITRMTSDINQVQTGLNLTLRLLLRSPFVVFGAMIMAFTIDVGSALVFAVAIPLLAAVVFGIMLFCIPMYRKAQEKLDHVLGATRENLTGVRVIRAFGKERSEKSRFDSRNEELTGAQKRVGRISALMNPLTYVMINVAIALLIWKGAIRVESGVLTQGQLIALYNYMSQILIELVKLANLIINITKSVACANRIAAQLEISDGEECRSERQAVRRTEGSLVELHDVSLRYRGAAADALSGIDLTIMPGETVGVIGGTGSGKSSLVNLIPRLYEASGGEVLFDGEDVRGVPIDRLRGMIGVVPQKSLLFSGTIRENLLWGDESADDGELYEALRTAQAEDVVAAKGGLDSAVEQGGRNFSGGQRQRLTIARALVRRPRLLILDDSSSALDFATDAALRRALSRLPGKPAVLIVSQRASSVMRADRIIVLDKGRAVGVGTHEQLLKSCLVYKEIYDSQLYREVSGE